MRSMCSSFSTSGHRVLTLLQFLLFNRKAFPLENLDISEALFSSNISCNWTIFFPQKFLHILTACSVCKKKRNIKHILNGLMRNPQMTSKSTEGVGEMVRRIKAAGKSLGLVPTTAPLCSALRL